MGDTPKPKVNIKIEEAFEVKQFKGLGMAYQCKLCGGVFRTIYDGIMHLTRYHDIKDSKDLECAIKGREILGELFKKDDKQEGLMKWLKR